MASFCFFKLGEMFLLEESIDFLEVLEEPLLLLCLEVMFAKGFFIAERLQALCGLDPDGLSDISWLFLFNFKGDIMEDLL